MRLALAFSLLVLQLSPGLGRAHRPPSAPPAPRGDDVTHEDTAALLTNHDLTELLLPLLSNLDSRHTPRDLLQKKRLVEIMSLPHKVKTHKGQAPLILLTSELPVRKKNKFRMAELERTKHKKKKKLYKHKHDKHHPKPHHKNTTSDGDSESDEHKHKKKLKKHHGSSSSSSEEHSDSEEHKKKKEKHKHESSSSSEEHSDSDEHKKVKKKHHDKDSKSSSEEHDKDKDKSDDKKPSDDKNKSKEDKTDKGKDDKKPLDNMKNSKEEAHDRDKNDKKPPDNKKNSKEDKYDRDNKKPPENKRNSKEEKYDKEIKKTPDNKKSSKADKNDKGQDDHKPSENINHSKEDINHKEKDGNNKPFENKENSKEDKNYNDKNKKDSKDNKESSKENKNSAENKNDVNKDRSDKLKPSTNKPISDDHKQLNSDSYGDTTNLPNSPVRRSATGTEEITGDITNEDTIHSVDSEQNGKENVKNKSIGDESDKTSESVGDAQMQDSELVELQYTNVVDKDAIHYNDDSTKSVEEAHHDVTEEYGDIVPIGKANNGAADRNQQHSNVNSWLSEQDSQVISDVDSSVGYLSPHKKSKESVDLALDSPMAQESDSHAITAEASQESAPFTGGYESADFYDDIDKKNRKNADILPSSVQSMLNLHNGQQNSVESFVELLDGDGAKGDAIPAPGFGYVYRNANKGDVSESHKTYKLSFRFNK